MDPTQLSFLLATDEQSVFSSYLGSVANQGLVRYKTVFQHGNKRGESLWTHIVNMVCLLEALQPLLMLEELESHILYTAVTAHDINKMRQGQQSYSDLAVEPVIREVLDEIGLDDFFADWRDYTLDIQALIRAHSGHYAVAGDNLIAALDPTRLGQTRIDELVHLLRALDTLDLSHSLDEHVHKNTALGHLNSYLNASGDPRMMAWYTHQVVEQRGLLTNVIHNALIDTFSAQYGLIPVLLYPDGVAYLAEQGTTIQPDIENLGEHIASAINAIVAGKPAELIDFKPNTGYKIKTEAFSLEVPFEQLWLEIRNQISTRKFTPQTYDETVRPGAIKSIQKTQQKQPEFGTEWLIRLEDPTPIVHGCDEQFRTAELARAYRLFVENHVKQQIGTDSWHYVYELLELPQEQWEFYDCFSSASHRHLVLAGDLTLSEDAVFERTLADAQTLLSETEAAHNAAGDLWAQYAQHYLLINGQPLARNGWGNHLAHYIANQHQQCVHCSGPFATEKWMSADVRDGIKVQQFSYRLEGGGRQEPKKYICGICKTQFLLEKLNYPAARGGDILYLHLYPYSFYPAPFIDALHATINRLRGTDLAIQALNLDVSEAVQNISAHTTPPNFRARTKQGKPQPYGIYMPQFSETMGGQFIFPVNAPDGNDTERFLFTLWFAIVLQRHFGVRVLMSASPVPPLDMHNLPDLYLDNIPLGCSGLLPQNDFCIFDNPEQPTSGGSLQRLWQIIEHLFALDRLVFNEDVKVALARAALSGPLGIFHTTDRLLQKHDRQRAGHDAFPHLKALALSIGGDWMAQLSDHLTALAELAWRNRILGRTLKRSSLLHPVDEVLSKMARLGGTFDREALIAATVQDIFAHLERTADEQYKPGRTKYQAVEQYVRLWYDTVLDNVYGSKQQRLLADERLLRSAYLFFIQAQIPQRSQESNESIEEEA